MANNTGFRGDFVNRTHTRTHAFSTFFVNECFVFFHFLGWCRWHECAYTILAISSIGYHAFRDPFISLKRSIFDIESGTKTCLTLDLEA